MLTRDAILKLGDDVKDLAHRLVVDDEAMKAMRDIYIAVYGEIYDAANTETLKFAEGLVPAIRLLNAKFKFKR